MLPIDEFQLLAIFLKLLLFENHQGYFTAFHGPYPARDRNGLCPVVKLIPCPCFIVYLTMLSVAQTV
jgi:hypothetical protein